MNDVDRLVARHYRKQTYSRARKEALEARVERIPAAGLNTSEPVEKRNARVRFWSVASNHHWLGQAAVGLSLMVGLMFFYDSSLKRERSETTLRAAALYHKTRLQLDFEGSSIVELRNKMDELPFTLQLPVSVDLQTFRLVGGRYCSINGQLAAHLRFKNPDSGRHFSLFQTALAPPLERLDLSSENIDGMAVRLWNEKLNFYVQAGG